MNDFEKLEEERDAWRARALRAEEDVMRVQQVMESGEMPLPSHLREPLARFLVKSQGRLFQRGPIVTGGKCMCGRDDDFAVHPRNCPLRAAALFFGGSAEVKRQEDLLKLRAAVTPAQAFKGLQMTASNPMGRNAMTELIEDRARDSADGTAYLTRALARFFRDDHD